MGPWGPVVKVSFSSVGDWGISPRSSRTGDCSTATLGAALSGVLGSGLALVGLVSGCSDCHTATLMAALSGVVGSGLALVGLVSRYSDCHTATLMAALSDVVGSGLALVGLVSGYCGWMRWKVFSATSVSVWQHI